MAANESSRVLHDASGASHLAAFGDTQLLHAHDSMLESTSSAPVGLRRDEPCSCPQLSSSEMVHVRMFTLAAISSPNQGRSLTVITSSDM